MATYLLFIIFFAVNPSSGLKIKILLRYTIHRTLFIHLDLRLVFMNMGLVVSDYSLQ